MKLVSSLVTLIGKIRWDWFYKWRYGRPYLLKLKDHAEIMFRLNHGNYIILTRRNTHLSTYMTAIAHFIMTGRFGYWSHALINIEPGMHKTPDGFNFVEAIGQGVKVSQFREIFNCDSAVILKPICNKPLDWENAIEESLGDVGKKYDTNFDLGDSSKMSCVELVLDALKRISNYEVVFKGLLDLIKKEGNLTPQMYYDCGSFEVILEIRR